MTFRNKKTFSTHRKIGYTVHKLKEAVAFLIFHVLFQPNVGEKVWIVKMFFLKPYDFKHCIFLLLIFRLINLICHLLVLNNKIILINLWLTLANSFPSSGNFCHLRLTFANSLVPDQARHYVGTDLVPNCLLVWWYMPMDFRTLVNLTS